MHSQVVMGALRVKQDELKAVLDKLAALDADLQEKTARKEALEAEVEMCKIKLDRSAQGCWCCLSCWPCKPTTNYYVLHNYALLAVSNRAIDNHDKVY